MNQFVIDLVDSDPNIPSPVHNKPNTGRPANSTLKNASSTSSNGNAVKDDCYKK